MFETEKTHARARDETSAKTRHGNKMKNAIYTDEAHSVELMYPFIYMKL